MSAVVTEPNSLPSSPTRAEKVSETCSSFAGEFLRPSATRLFSAASSRSFSCAMRFLLPGGRLVGDAARQQEVARVARRHLHDVARMSELVDRLSQNDFHRNPNVRLTALARRRQSSHVSPRPSPKRSRQHAPANNTANADQQRHHEPPGRQEPERHARSRAARTARRRTAAGWPRVRALRRRPGTTSIASPATNPQMNWSLKRNSLSVAERRADAGAPHAVIQRPRQPERGQRLQRQQSPGRTSAVTAVERTCNCVSRLPWRASPRSGLLATKSRHSFDSVVCRQPAADCSARRPSLARHHLPHRRRAIRRRERPRHRQARSVTPDRSPAPAGRTTAESRSGAKPANAAASSTPQPAARNANVPPASRIVHSTQPASRHPEDRQRRAVRRPTTRRPHRPRGQGRGGASVWSTGSTTGTSGVTGTNRNSSVARTTRHHPRSRGVSDAGAVGTSVIGSAQPTPAGRGCTGSSAR